MAKIWPCLRAVTRTVGHSYFVRSCLWTSIQIGRVCSGGGTEFQDRDGAPTIYVSGPCTRDEGAGDGLQSPSAGEHAVSPRCGDGSGRADGEDCKEEQQEEPAVGPTTLGHDEPGQPPAAGSNEVPVPKLQSAPIKLPGAPHPPPQLPDGVFPIGGAEVIKRSKNKRIRRKRAQESAARDEDGGPSQDLRGFIGNTFNTEPTLEAQVVGVRIGAVKTNAPVIFANNVKNVEIEAAVQKRIDEKQVPCTMSDEDRKRIGRGVSAALGMGPHAKPERTVWSRGKISKIMEEIISLGQVKSKKWCESRFNAGFEKLMRQYNPDFKMTAKVKIEPMAPGKAPRLLIADGDTGQLMALLGIHIFEELLFRKYHKRSIKHRSRKFALMEVHQYLNGDQGGLGH